MVLIAFIVQHVLGSARVLGWLARKLRPRHPRPVSWSQAAHFIAFMVFIALMAFISWPSSHGRHRMASLCLAGPGCSVD